MLRLFSLIFVLKILLLQSLWSQQYDFRQYSIEQGLPQSQVINLLVDKRGFLWGSTFAGGFFRFEGTHFVNFDRQNSPIIGTIASMLATQTDELFVITENGILWQFDGYDYKEISQLYQQELPKGFIPFSYSLRAAHNHLFFLQIFDNQQNSHLLLFDGKQFINYSTKYQKDFLSLTITPKNDLFLSTKNEGVFVLVSEKLQPSSFQNHPILGKDMPFVVGTLQPNKLLVVAISPFSQIDKRSTPRLFVYQDNKFTPFELPTAIQDYLEQGLGFYEDSRGEIWIYNPNNWESEFGVWRYKKGTFTHYNAKNGLMNNNVIKVVEDLEGNIWLSTSGSGIIRFGGDKFLHFTKETGLQDEVVWQFWQAPDKSVYMGTGTGIAKVQNSQMKFMPFNPTDHLAIHAGNKVYRGGLLLAHTDSRSANGLLVFDDREQKIPLARHLGLPDEFDHAYFQGYKEGAIVLTTNQGIVLYYHRNKYITEKQDSLLQRFNPKKSQLRYLGTDQKGHEWFQRIQNNEVVVYEPNPLKVDKNTSFEAQLKAIKNSPIVRISKMLGDKQGRSWLVTIDDGLYFIDEQKRVKHITPEQGLSSMACYDVLEDKKGNVWVGTQKGIDKVNISSDGNIKIRQYGKYEGFFGEETNSGAALEDADGNLWFGHIKGATQYNPLADRQSSTPPSLYLTGIRLFSKEVNWQDSLKDYHKGVDKWFNLPLQLTLPYNINHISFDFTALSYKNPERVVYQWKLEGAYNEWLPITDNPEAVFTNLPYGTYAFCLRAANGEGTWTATPLTYKFTISPPFWATWWFRISGILLGLLATYLFTKWRLRTIEAEKAELDLLIKQRTEEIEAQKNEIAAQRDNLSGLNIEMALQKEEIETQRDKLEKSFQNLQILSDVVREITATLNTKQIISTVYQRINALMKAEGFGIGLYNKEKHCLDFAGYIENGVELAFHQDELHPVGCFSAWSFVHQQEIIMNDIAVEYHRYLPDRQTPKVGETLQSIIYLPLITCDKLIGVITVQSFSKNAYNDQDLTLLRNIANYAATALDNAAAYHFIEKQQKEISVKNEDITASISYALRIQQSMLPLQEEIAQVFEHFIFFQPKDIVSGDFYWFHTFPQENSANIEAAMMVVADCTGHGVPGAMMSMIGNSLLNKIVIDKGVRQADLIINELHKSVRATLKQDTTESRDGMDLALIYYNLHTKELTFAGARNPIYLVHKTENGQVVLEHLKADKNPIGGFQYEQQQRVFSQQTIKITVPTTIYLFTDGYQDQFSKDNSRKFMSKRMREMFMNMYDKPMEEQGLVINQVMQEWKGDNDQLDDMLVVGLKITDV